MDTPPSVFRFVPGWEGSLGWLESHPGVWESGVTIDNYQWLRDGVEIPGATGKDYGLRGEDIGRAISVRVTANKSGFSAVSGMSQTFTPPRGELYLKPTPMLDFPVAWRIPLGSTIHVRPGTWDQGVELSYEWLRNGVVVQGATGPTYLVGAADRGATISVRVTGSKLGYSPVVRTSLASNPVSST